MSQEKVQVTNQYKPFSQSPIWDLQRHYYDSQGVEAWDDEVPFYITSNPLIAYQYAKVIFSSFQDWLALHPNHHAETFYIIELGTGTGQFSFYMLKALFMLKEAWGDAVNGINFCYVMTDFTENNLNFWKQHAALQPYIEQGCLDFAIFDTENDAYIKLTQKNVTLSPQSLLTPLVVIANYLFDSVVMDVFHVSGGTIQETQAQLSTNGIDVGAQTNWDKVTLNYKNCDMADNYYQNARFDSILADYKHQLEESYLHFPIAALRCLDRLSELSSGKLLLLSSDKGYLTPEEVDGEELPELDSHGSFSLMVNYDAIARYFENRGGWVSLQDPFDLFATGFFALGFSPKSLHTRKALDELFRGQCPGHYYYSYDHFDDNVASASLEVVASMFALSHWCPAVLEAASDRISELIEEADEDVAMYLETHMDRVGENFFYVPGAEDVLFLIGVFFLECSLFDKAIDYFKRSLVYFDSSYEHFFNLGCCYAELDRPSDALEYFDQAKACNPHSRDLKKHIRECKHKLVPA